MLSQSSKFHYPPLQASPKRHPRPGSSDLRNPTHYLRIGSRSADAGRVSCWRTVEGLCQGTSRTGSLVDYVQRELTWSAKRLLDWQTGSWERFAGRRALIVDQLLELHADLTDVQARLLAILKSRFEEAQARDLQQRAWQAEWNDFTWSLEQSLDMIAKNTTQLMRDLFSGLLSLQSLTRDSTRFVSDGFQTLESGVQSLKYRLQDVDHEIDEVGKAGKMNVAALTEMAQRRLSLVGLFTRPYSRLFMDSRLCTPTVLYLFRSIWRISIMRWYFDSWD